MSPEKFLFTNLWLQHVTLTRDLIFFTLIDAEEKKSATVKALLQSAEELGKFIGKDCDEGFRIYIISVLKEHIFIAKELIEKDGDDTNLTKEWYSNNADQIIEALAVLGINKTELRKHFYAHLQLTTKEILFISNDESKNDIENFKLILANILTMSELIYDQIILEDKPGEVRQIPFGQKFIRE